MHASKHLLLHFDSKKNIFAPQIFEDVHISIIVLHLPMLCNCHHDSFAIQHCKHKSYRDIIYINNAESAYISVQDGKNCENHRTMFTWIFFSAEIVEIRSICKTLVWKCVKYYADKYDIFCSSTETTKEFKQNLWSSFTSKSTLFQLPKLKYHRSPRDNDHIQEACSQLKVHPHSQTSRDIQIKKLSLRQLITEKQAIFHLLAFSKSINC